ncbi:MAG: D-aminoacylase [Chloroflexi bacterium]|nr:D-aminoacylase [Chloroflexota bacterium]
MFERVIAGGRVVDGSGSPGIVADVGISGGRITAVGDLASADVRKRVDVTGMTVAPGFIDIHSHSDFLAPAEEHGEILAPFLGQGITTIVTGNCGYSPAPVNPATADELDSYTAFLRGPDLPRAWDSFGSYLGYLDDHGVALNVVPLVAHGALRIQQIGFQGRDLESDEQAAMRRSLEQSLEEGAFGLSSGLLYAPGIFAPPEEIEALAAGLKQFDGIYTSHIRGSSETLLSATKEVIRVGEVNGISCQHSHIEAFGKPHWPKIDAIVELHERARERGVDTGFDVIPYVAANTTLLAIFPPWALSGGVEALLARLRDPEQRQRIRRSIDEDIPGWPCWIPGAWPHNLVEATGWDNISLLWVESEANKGLEGKTMPQIAAERGTDPFEAAAAVVLEENGHAMALYVGVSGDLEDDSGLRRLLKHPWASIETDAILTGRGVPHPAAYGAFPRVLGHFSRDTGLFSLEEAIRKMTSLPAERFGLRARGRIAEGYAADVVVFDAQTVADQTSYQDPTAAPTGIEYVFVNGVVVVDHGAIDTNRRAGTVLRRGASDA